MAGERRLNWGADATDARYRTEDTGDGGNFVVAEDLDGGTVLLEYDSTASEWVVRGPVNMDGNAITNVSDLDVSSATINNGDGIGLPTSSTTISPSFDTWEQPDANRPTLIYLTVTAETDGSTAAFIELEVDFSGGTTADLTHNLSFADENAGSGFRDYGNLWFTLPAGGQFRVVNNTDPNGNNLIIDAEKITA